jgi:hypothetical protein
MLWKQFISTLAVFNSSLILDNWYSKAVKFAQYLTHSAFILCDKCWKAPYLPNCAAAILDVDWIIVAFIHCRNFGCSMSDLWLKWNSQLELLSSLDNLLETESFVDVTIAVEGQLLKAHRVILCASRYGNILTICRLCNTKS